MGVCPSLRFRSKETCRKRLLQLQRRGTLQKNQAVLASYNLEHSHVNVTTRHGFLKLPLGKNCGGGPGCMQRM